MFKAGLDQPCEAFETVRMDGGTGCNVTSKYRDYRAGLKVRNHVHAGSTGGSSTLLHSHQNERCSSILELSAPSQPGLLAANPRLVNLYFTAQGFPNCVHHCPTEFVKHHPRSLVTRKTELTLQEQCGNAALIRGHQIRRPEPVGQRNLGPMQNRPGCQRNLVSAFGALLAPLIHQFIRLIVPTSGTGKPIRPTTRPQILLASLFRGEIGLKLTQRLGEWRSGHPNTLPIGAC